MKRIVRILKSIYDFFAGDVILLIAVGVAFGATAILAFVLHEENILLAVILVGVIVLGIVTSIGRELGAAMLHTRKDSSNTDRTNGMQGG